MSFMQLTIDSREPLSDVLRIVGAAYHVTLIADNQPGDDQPTHDQSIDDRPVDDAVDAAPSARRRGWRSSLGGGARRRSASADRSRVDTQTVRRWAAHNGFDVSARGPLASSVREAYTVAQAT